MNELALFAGAGGGLLASKLLGWNTVCAVEIEKYPREVLLQRQRDGLLERFPIWDDVCTFDGKPWRGKIDVISGGFPCQDISSAGKGEGITGERSGLWKQYARIIDEVRPNVIFAENSPLLRTRGLGTILKDLAGMGYNARWGVLGAWHVGARHKRNRMWIVAYPNMLRCADEGDVGYQPGRAETLRTSSPVPKRRGAEYKGAEEGCFQVDSWANSWPPEPEVGRVADGMANRMDMLKALGNGQVPRVAATAHRILMQ